MTPLALTFMIGSWSFVLGLTAWCFSRVLRGSGRSGPGPARRPDAPTPDDRAAPPAG